VIAFAVVFSSHFVALGRGLVVLGCVVVGVFGHGCPPLIALRH
jgi:hypothetical protein